MTVRDVVNRIVAPLARAVEGAVRPGPYQLPVTGGWLPDGVPTNWWQTGMNPYGFDSRSAMVEACVSAYGQTVAMLRGDHYKGNSKGGRDRVENSALAAVLQKPNDYESTSDFLLNAVRQLYLEGNAYALALRDQSTFQIKALHIMDSRMSLPQLAENGEVFYHLAGNNVIAQRLVQSSGMPTLVVPQRDVLHIRLHATSPKWPYPLRGETPLMAVYGDLAMVDAIKNQQVNFYVNQARPSAVLTTDMALKREQVEELRQRWMEQAKGLDGCGPGGVPILTAGLKVQPWAMPVKDASVADMLTLNFEQIALAFRIPLAVLGLTTRLHSSSFSSTEALMQFWIATGLGFCLDRVERAFDGLFGLKGEPDEYTEFDTSALLRSAFKDRIDGLTKAVQGGIYSPNEARNIEGLNNVPFGDEPRVQQQVVPLSAASSIQPASPFGTGPKPAPSPAPASPPSAPPSAPTGAKDFHDNVRRFNRIIRQSADDHDRRRAV